MERYKVILAYDGTAFSGMQRQASERTVQGEVEAALAKLGWNGKSVLFAGRTDAGVHAVGQVLSFEMKWTHSDQDIENALNATMPSDLAVRQVEKVDATFHPRYDAKLRHYRYRIYCQAQRDPLRERYAWRQWPEPKLERLNAEAAYLIGNHDFASFGTPPKAGGPTVRKVVKAEWLQKEDEITFTISANAFLYHMVRRIVGQLVKVGKNKAEASSVERLLKARKELIQELAPAQGLSLVSVDYE
jgi:tRNA pseudouridine38-40 synthase